MINEDGDDGLDEHGEHGEDDDDGQHVLLRRGTMQYQPQRL